jgi:hypothetical protein
MRSRSKRALAFGGVAGPVAFVASWSLLGATAAASYSPVEDAISRLAQVDAPSRAGMTIGFKTFGIGVSLFGLALRDELPGPAWKAAVATGVATLAVGATPLETSKQVDLLHAAAATLGYTTLALAAWLAAPYLGRRGARLSRMAAVGCGAALAATVVASPAGLMQRLGLTIGDAWIVATSLGMLRRSNRQVEEKLARARPRVVRADVAKAQVAAP